ncbi:MAG: hypothetical protein OEX17_03295 [Rhodospirillaceae bacterium]|nr:hypothetical protein [Rhodospirillaceae bacterium]
MSYKSAPSNDNQSITYETASQYVNYQTGASNKDFFEDGFFNMIAFRGFMVLSISAIAANLRVILENVL